MYLHRLRFSGGNYVEFANILNDFPTTRRKLLEYANERHAAKLKEPITSVEIALSMLGFRLARNFLAGSLIETGDNETDENGDVQLPELFYAPTAEQDSRDDHYATDYYVAGLVYDILASAVKARFSPELQETALPGITEIFRHGMHISRIATQLAKKLVPEMNLEKEIVLDACLHDIGKVGYLLNFGGFLESDPDRPKARALAESRLLFEKHHYGMTHDALGYLLLSKVGFLTDTSWVCFFHHQPFLSLKSGPYVQARAYLVWLADHFHRYQKYHHATKLNRELISAWHRCSEPFIPKRAAKDFLSALSSIRIE